MTDISPERIEPVAIAIWQEDSQRAAGRPRYVDWSDIAEDEKQKFRGFAKAALTSDATAIEGARAAGMEWCEKLIRENCESLVSNASGDFRSLRPRRDGDLMATGYADAIRREIEAIRSRTPVAAEADKGWRVKLLDWQGSSKANFFAFALWGTYRVEIDNGRWAWSCHWNGTSGCGLNFSSSEKEAKAAAQADYEKRVQSCFASPIHQL